MIVLSTNTLSVLVVERSVVRSLFKSFIPLFFIIFFTLFIVIFIVAAIIIIAPDLAATSILALILAPILAPLIVFLLLIRRMLIIRRRNHVLREFSKKLESHGSNALLGERVELFKATFEGAVETFMGGVGRGLRKSRRVRAKGVYMTIKSLEKIGEEYSGQDIAELGSGNVMAILPSNEGLFDGKILKIAGGDYDNIAIIPITPRITSHKVIEESVVGDDEACNYGLELEGCRIRGNITPLISKRARSYRVEIGIGGDLRVKGFRLPLELFSKRIYSGEPGTFEAEAFICKPMILLVDMGTIDMEDIARKIKKFLRIRGLFGQGEATLIGYRENVYVLKLVIDRPLAKDLVKEIPI